MRFLLLLAGWTLLTRCALADGSNRNDKPEPRIVGGAPVSSRGEYPYLVDLDNSKGEHKCHGALLAPDLVLTAAHCRGAFSSAHVGRFDKSDPNDGHDALEIGSVILHPLFIEKDFIYDVMVVRLKGRSDKPVLRINSDADMPAAGQELRIAGFGNTETNAEEYPERLLDTSVRALTNEECELAEGPFFAYLGEISDDMMCAQERGQDSCQGDSGGPLILKGNSPAEDVQIGIVSWGRDCADPDYPGVYSRISNSFDWLRRLVCQESVDPPAYLECSRIISVPPPAPAPAPAPTPPSPPAPGGVPPKKDPLEDDSKDDSSKVYGDDERGNLTRRRRRGRRIRKGL